MRTRVRKRWENDYVPTALLVVLGFLYVCIFILPHLPGSKGREERKFVYSRIPQTSFMMLLAGDDYSDRVRKLFHFDKESIRQDSIEIFDSAFGEERIPIESKLDWAIFFLKIGDEERMGRCLEEIGDVEDELENRHALVVSLAEGGDLSPDIVDWVYTVYRDGKSELPEWYYLAVVRGDEDVAGWLENEGALIISRGVFASTVAVAAIGISLLAGICFLIFRKKFPLPKSGRILFRSWRWKVVVREYFIAYLVTLLVVGIVSLFLFVSRYDTAVLVTSVVFMSVPCLWMVLRLTPSPKAALRAFELIRSKWPAGKLILFGLVGIAWLGIELILLRLFAPTGMGLEDAIRPEFLDRKFAIANGFLIAGLVAPICEEVIFRGFLWGGLTPRFGGIPAAVLTSALFALLHGYSQVGLIATFGYGLVFCWMFARSGSLWPGIIAHGLFNIVVLLQVESWYSLH
ncbi:MAG: hypothetical protein CMO55_00080 [Verrucomicrobiales bacterium]|nr:hypothetical protein [Verrucomicrobiales bacterium]